MHNPLPLCPVSKHTLTAPAAARIAVSMSGEERESVWRRRFAPLLGALSDEVSPKAKGRPCAEEEEARRPREGPRDASRGPITPTGSVSPARMLGLALPSSSPEASSPRGALMAASLLAPAVLAAGSALHHVLHHGPPTHAPNVELLRGRRATPADARRTPPRVSRLTLLTLHVGTATHERTPALHALVEEHQARCAGGAALALCVDARC